MGDGFEISLQGVAGDGTPLGKLAEIVELKAAVLYKTWSDAAIGAMITAIKSLRTMTKKASPQKTVKPQIKPIRGGLRVAWTTEGGKRRRCLRNRRGVRDESLQKTYKVKWYCSRKSKTARPFLVIPEHKRAKPYVSVAENTAAARARENMRAEKRKRSFGGFARTALGMAMARLSTRNPDGKRIFMGQRTSWKSLVAAGVKYGFFHGKTEVFANDLIDYAAPAVKGGRASVDLAFKRAANKITGEMMHYISKVGNDFFTSMNKMPVPQLSIPYPEIRRQS